MKRISYIILILVIFGILLVAGEFYWNNLRGAGPAFKKPPQDIVELLDGGKNSPQNTTRSGQDLNGTSMPLTIPKGYSLEIYAKNLGAPRVMAYDTAGNLLVSIPKEGKVVALKDTDSDGKSDQQITVVEGLNRPHGLAFRCRESCALYIAESDAIATYTYDEKNLKALNRKKIIDLPDGGRHFSRTIMFMPYPLEDTLLISIGSSCDVCDESDPRRAAIYSANYDGTDFKPYATGLRNSVFMAIHPVSGDIWATDMGRDGLGDNLPPDEINIVQRGGFYGWPTCYGNNSHDTAFDKKTYIKNPCEKPEALPSHIDIPAHSAPLGIAFIPEEGWPEDYWYNALVAYHGSWNRTMPTGYKIVRYKLDAKGKYLGEEDFISGWLTKDGALGRPVDILTQPGGTVYISDDKAGVIYRMYRTPRLRDLSDMIQVDDPKSDGLVASPLTVTGTARGTWYFEASFPLVVTDATKKVIGTGIAQAQADWMTEDFVPFAAQVTFSKPETPTGYLILKKDNPSGLPEYDAQIEIPIRFSL